MTRMCHRHRRPLHRDLYPDPVTKYRPNPRASRGAQSTPARRKLIAGLRAALPPSSNLTTNKPARALVDEILLAAGCGARNLSVMYVREQHIVRATRQYAALYARHVFEDDRVALEIPCMRKVLPRPGCPASDIPREAENRSEIPVIQLAESIAVVEWPPPPQLSSTALAGFVYKTASKEFQDVTPGVAAVTAGGDAAKCDDANGEIPKDDAGNGGVANVDATSGDAADAPLADGASPTDVIFIAPCIDEQADLEDPRKYSVVLATTGSHDALMRFAGDVADWATERSQADEPEDTHFGLYRLKESSWVHEEDRRARKVDSVFLPVSQRDDLLDDARRFFSDETRVWYADHGVPYRRAYLFHGPPGTGKTSMIKALSSELRRNSCFLSMVHALTPEDVADAIGNLPVNPLIVIEDVDALFRSNAPSKMTFSALLNILDGLMSSEGVLTIMTTNHVTRIDPIAIRAGRVDRMFFFGPANDAVLRQCFRYFYKKASDETVEKFVAVLQKGRDVKARSIATLQEHFIEMREKSAEECVEKLPMFVKSYVNRAQLLKEMEDKFKEDTGTEGAPFMLDGEHVNKYAETEDKAARPHMFT